MRRGLGCVPGFGRTGPPGAARLLLQNTGRAAPRPRRLSGTGSPASFGDVLRDGYTPTQSQRHPTTNIQFADLNMAGQGSGARHE
jgi:hypothetical protein